MNKDISIIKQYIKKHIQLDKLLISKEYTIDDVLDDFKIITIDKNGYDDFYSNYLKFYCCGKVFTCFYDAMGSSVGIPEDVESSNIILTDNFPIIIFDMIMENDDY